MPHSLTKGHSLFEEWLTKQDRERGRKPRNPERPRPSYAALTEARDELEALQELVAGAVVPKHAYGGYHYLASAAPGVLRTPRQGLRALIELLTRGAVPRESWTEVIQADGSPGTGEPPPEDDGSDDGSPSTEGAEDEEPTQPIIMPDAQKGVA
ncbi:MAG: hypothetical protein VKL39_24430 [Leptolyngbyaceae bacterium]|nr:hypothetical protein [Leptolyngbyaceae bacterium]